MREQIRVRSLVVVRNVRRQHLDLEGVRQVPEELRQPLAVAGGHDLAGGIRLEVHIRWVPRPGVSQHHGPHGHSGNEGALSERHQRVPIAAGPLGEQEHGPAARGPLVAMGRDRLHRGLPGLGVRPVDLDHPDLLGETANHGRVQRPFHRDDLRCAQDRREHRAVEVAHVVGHDQGGRLHVLRHAPARQRLVHHRRDDAIATQPCREAGLEKRRVRN
mmetsp:Transcript_85156/g.260224  ORF Transcript_85156/g.260224 Transcript_85156/m.260224 type:complete len:217 (+) Transcript_85156:412-1062(+)